MSTLSANVQSWVNHTFKGAQKLVENLTDLSFLTKVISLLIFPPSLMKTLKRFCGFFFSFSDGANGNNKKLS